MAPAHPGPEVSGLQGLGDGSGKLLALVHGSQPEGELVGKVMAGAAGTIALDEWSSSEVLETGSRAG